MMQEDGVLDKIDAEMLLGAIKAFLKLVELEVDISSSIVGWTATVFTRHFTSSAMKSKQECIIYCRKCDDFQDACTSNYESKTGAILELWNKILYGSNEFDYAMMMMLKANGSSISCYESSWKPFKFKSLSDLKMQLALRGL